MNRTRLNLRLDTTSTNLIIKGYINNYIRLQYNEQIVITCSKTFGVVNGTISAFVNTKSAFSNNCIRYHQNFIGDENYCLEKQFSYTLELDRSSLYEISCRFVETNNQDSATLILTRLCNNFSYKLEKFVLSFSKVKF